MPNSEWFQFTVINFKDILEVLVSLFGPNHCKVELRILTDFNMETVPPEFYNHLRKESLWKCNSWQRTRWKKNLQVVSSHIQKTAECQDVRQEVYKLFCLILFYYFTQRGSRERSTFIHLARDSSQTHKFPHFCLLLVILFWVIILIIIKM